ncbi:MAG: alpha-ribazole phosphatase [Bacillota bacterium]|nr:alpha-ribazole phosphatase [Bacillota bacterium]
MRIILIRHGQTEWNALMKYQGQTDIDLNKVGREQAQRLARYFAEQGTEIEALYCSDLSRCRETAEIIGKEVGLKPILDTSFREINFGCWEGLTHTEVIRQYNREYDDWVHRTLQFQIAGGESVQDVLERCLPGIHHIAGNHQGTIIVVTHGGLIKILLNHLGLPEEEWKTYLHSGSMTTLEYKENEFIPIEIGLTVD